MVCKAYLRADLKENFPKCGYPPLIGLDTFTIDWMNEKFICFQPDELDNEEFNLILYCPKRKIAFLGMSIDFDFE